MNLSMEESRSPLCECVLYTLHCSPCWLSVTCRNYFSGPPKPPKQSHCLSLHPVHAWGVVNGKCPSGFLPKTLKKPMPTVKKMDTVCCWFCYAFAWGKCFQIGEAGAHSCGAFCVDTYDASSTSQCVSLFTVWGLDLQSYPRRKCVVAKRSYTQSILILSR